MSDKLTPKSLTETLCLAQVAIGHLSINDGEKVRRIDILQQLINQLNDIRPIGNDGKHDERHTKTCGCEDHDGTWSLTFDSRGSK